MFADVEARGGILEPPAAAEVLFKKDKHTFEMMHRCDDVLRELDARRAKGEDVAKEIKQREKLLLPVYQQIAWEYCDLHDKAPRMKSLGAIREGLRWAESREYLHWRIRRRMQENSVARQLMGAVRGLSYMGAMEVVASLCSEAAQAAGAGAEDRAVAMWIEEHPNEVQARIEEERQRATEEEIYRLISALPESKRAEVARDLVGYSRVAAKAGA
jgi:acetyl-CoA carboxylase/biotin carboxylase 1